VLHGDVFVRPGRIWRRGTSSFQAERFLAAKLHKNP
jgi:hypothetical protein